eukprot:2307759-Alexandrium_andersonii.AAC.1
MNRPRMGTYLVTGALEGLVLHSLFVRAEPEHGKENLPRAPNIGGNGGRRHELWRRNVGARNDCPDHRKLARIITSRNRLRAPPRFEPWLPASKPGGG